MTNPERDDRRKEGKETFTKPEQPGAAQAEAREKQAAGALLEDEAGLETRDTEAIPEALHEQRVRAVVRSILKGTLKEKQDTAFREACLPEAERRADKILNDNKKILSEMRPRIVGRELRKLIGDAKKVLSKDRGEEFRRTHPPPEERRAALPLGREDDDGSYESKSRRSSGSTARRILG